jgi:hypothetical protein
MVSIFINKVINNDLHIVVDHLILPFQVFGDGFYPSFILLGVAIDFNVSVCYEFLKIAA